MRRRALLAASQTGGGITIEKGQYYPDLAEYLVDKYGFGFGSIRNPVAIEEDIFIGNSFATRVGVGQVKFIYINSNRSANGVCLYLEDYKYTYYCVVLNNQTDSEYYGLSNYYLWD